jgi:hypothetical protein
MDGLPQQTGENFTVRPSADIVMCRKFMFNEKFREGVPAWTAFHSRQVRTSQSGLVQTN